MKLDGYIRVSDVHGRQGESFISPDVQREAIEGWAKLHGHEIAVMHEELDVSGGKTDRPLLNEVMRRIEAGETEGVVVWKLDRFGRTLVGCLELMKRIQDAGANFASVTDQFDLSTPNGRLVLNMMLSIAQFELERIGASWREARSRAMKRGRHLGNRPPFGYAKREDGRLEPHPVNGPLVTEIFTRRAAGQSWHAIQTWIQSTGARTGVGRSWRTSTLRALGGNEIYLGMLLDRGTNQRVEGTHPPLTDRATFHAVQLHRGVRQGGSGLGEKALLRGLVRCANCRYAMQPFTVSPDAFGYKCGALHVCDQPTQIKADKGGKVRCLHEYVLEQVFARLPEIEAEAFGVDTEIAEMDAAAKAARAELHAYLADTELEQTVGREAFLTGAAARRHAADVAKTQVDDVLRANAGRLQQPVRRLRGDWETMTTDEQRTALASMIQAVFIRRPPGGPGSHNGASASTDRVHIVWFDDPGADLPHQGRRDYVVRPFVFPDGHHPDHIREAAA